MAELAPSPLLCLLSPPFPDLFLLSSQPSSIPALLLLYLLERSCSDGSCWAKIRGVSSQVQLLFDLVPIMHVQQQSFCRGGLFTSVFNICADVCCSVCSMMEKKPCIWNSAYSQLPLILMTSCKCFRVYAAHVSDVRKKKKNTM